MCVWAWDRHALTVQCGVGVLKAAPGFYGTFHRQRAVDPVVGGLLGEKGPERGGGGQAFTHGSRSLGMQSSV